MSTIKSKQWKDKLTPNQLERKRKMDRLSQRNYRKQFRQTEKELAYFRIVANGEHDNVVEQLLAQIQTLKTQNSWQQVRLEAIASLQEKGDDTNNASAVEYSLGTKGPLALVANDEKHNRSTANLPQQRDPGRVEPDARGNGDATPWYRARHSLFWQLGQENKYLLQSPEDEMWVNVILESLMTWKVKHGYGNDNLRLLIDYSDYAIQLSVEEVERGSRAKGLFGDIHDAILWGKEFSSPSACKHDDKEFIDQRELERRIAAFVAFKSTLLFKNSFLSPMEHMCIFWTYYRYYVFLCFPTTENWKRCLKWQRPVKDQFIQQHTWFLDGMIWPDTRSRMLQSGSHYDVEKLMRSLTANLKMKNFTDPLPLMISVKRDMSDLVIDPSLESFFDDVNNFTLLPTFSLTNPDLAELADLLPTSVIEPSSRPLLTLELSSSISARSGDCSNHLCNLNHNSLQRKYDLKAPFSTSYLNSGFFDDFLALGDLNWDNDPMLTVEEAVYSNPWDRSDDFDNYISPDGGNGSERTQDQHETDMYFLDRFTDGAQNFSGARSSMSE
ncbi:hypothetical protein Z517_06487 [Fonsecaea pedrosoi CBS 271.37]|uniref:BZIP domain-containing protein n=1 Tax=Fonsecaea pedrosoi CBS 271.37 TaxID=1442368 RepID=A0A0D2EZW1_9EURO|nr:uncharacterized protein Z517_06487 [Fonsecaea pedrosoi CBS 271.37]KIW79872.1 hypothetical protein Z517_06487 [Fonsecaea pedrosoi CBS 271.37]